MSIQSFNKIFSGFERVSSPPSPRQDSSQGVGPIEPRFFESDSDRSMRANALQHSLPVEGSPKDNTPGLSRSPSSLNFSPLKGRVRGLSCDDLSSLQDEPSNAGSFLRPNIKVREPVSQETDADALRESTPKLFRCFSSVDFLSQGGSGSNQFYNDPLIEDDESLGIPPAAPRFDSFSLRSEIGEQVSRDPARVFLGSPSSVTFSPDTDPNVKSEAPFPRKCYALSKMSGREFQEPFNPFRRIVERKRESQFYDSCLSELSKIPKPPSVALSNLKETEDYTRPKSPRIERNFQKGLFD